ncbi:hypothetical protein ACF3DV_14930 [Chlorogloeopsis fritschii PCC 9212]|nr:hypothetical protein [Chlorogloeopsis fritschii]
MIEKTIFRHLIASDRLLAANNSFVWGENKLLTTHLDFLKF